ncbi:MAG TPA: hypothetical protein VMV94_20820 [Phycisphaerae bacterium]|nr:hypothetical protein [Phycisphaerae bacterium]
MCVLAEGDNVWTFLMSIPWWVWIPVVAIIAGLIRQAMCMSQKHRERLEMIRHGIDPRDHSER